MKNTKYLIIIGVFAILISGCTTKIPAGAPFENCDERLPTEIIKTIQNDRIGYHLDLSTEYYRI